MPNNKLLTDLRRFYARHVIACTLALGFIIIVFAIFNPSLQKKLILKYGPAHVEHLALERVHVLPWKIQLDGLKVGFAGGNFLAEAFEFRFCLSSLLFGTVDIKTLHLNGGIVDLRNFKPPPSEPSDQPFAGVFATIDRGFDLKIDDANIQTTSLLSPQQTLRLRIQGGQIAREKSGALQIIGQFDDSATGVVDFDGALALDQLERGRFNSITIDLNAAADISSLDVPEYLSLHTVLAPSADPPVREIEVEDGAEPIFVPEPDNISVQITQTDADKTVRAALQIDAIYAGEKGLAAGDYSLSTNEKLALPYLGEVDLPPFDQVARGKFEVDIMSFAGTASIDSQTAITELDKVLGGNERLPTKFTLLNNIAVKFSSTEVLIEQVNTQIKDDNPNTIFDAALVDPLTIDLSDPTKSLHVARSLMSFKLGHILIAWLDALVPDYTITSGQIDGAFSLDSDEAGNIMLSPGQPLVIDGIRIDKEGEALIDNLRIEMTPRGSKSATQTDFSITDLKLSIGDAHLATIELSGRMPRSEEGVPKTLVESSGQLWVDPIITQPNFQTLFPDLAVPAGLALSFKGALEHAVDALTIQKFKATIAQDDQKKLIEIVAKQVFKVQLGAGAAEIDNPSGELAELTLNNIDLAWANPFAAPYKASGKLKSAKFSLGAGEAGLLRLDSQQALSVTGMNLSEGNKALLKDVSIRLRPSLTYTPEVTQLSYTDLKISSARRRLIEGSGEVKIRAQQDKAPAVDAQGKLQVEINKLLAQPIIAASLPAGDFNTPIATSMSYSVSHDEGATNINSLDLELLHKERSFLSLKTDSGLRLKPVLAPGENLAQHAIGEASFVISGLNPAILADVMPATGLKFASLDAGLRLRSDGSRLFANSEQALVIRDVRITDPDGGAVLHPFDVRSSANIETTAQQLDAVLSEFALNFSGESKPALSGTLEARIEPEKTIRLQRLRTQFSGFLPRLLNQPVVLPGHALSNGVLATSIEVDPDGRIGAQTTIDQLASSEPLAIHTIDMPLTGRMRPDGKGFEFTMPFTGTGKSGLSDAIVTGSYLPKTDKKALLNLGVKSTLFYLNDILATIEGIKRPPAKEKLNESGEVVPVAVDDTPDSAAFWDVLPYATRLEFDFAETFYSEYVALSSISGSADITDTNLTLNDFSARFHESPITLDGGLAFDSDPVEPYAADFTGKIKDFDLNQFFTELAPSKKSRIEGLFGVDIVLGGRTPNVAQFRNRLLLDLKMQSRNGLFRPLPPDSILMTGASDALGIIGEGLSYVPTGGFGAGAVSRLVNYIAEIEYDSVDVRIKRDRSLDLNIERIDMLSPSIHMAATGLIEYVRGTDILDSPLNVTANLNMTGKGAAILYSMSLLEDEQDKYGYYKGPEIQISGSASATESNFADIIEQASDGTVKGGITRPISGLIGNIKHRWFGEDIEAVSEPDPSAPAVTEPAAVEAR